MNRTKIEWTDMTWNPLTGCFHGCAYCYARRIAERFASKDPHAMREAYSEDGTLILEKPYVYDGKFEPYPYGFLPTFHMHRLHDLEDFREPKKVFVCSMADLFGEWVPDWVVEQVLEACRRSPQHKYLFLTKNPARYNGLIDNGVIKPEDDNFWLGSTLTGSKNDFFWSTENHTFWSCEPLLEPWPSSPWPPISVEFPEWVILGAETGNRRNRVVPEKKWVDDIVEKCSKVGIPVFMKDSLIPIVGEDGMRREFPEGLNG